MIEETEKTTFSSCRNKVFQKKLKLSIK